MKCYDIYNISILDFGGRVSMKNFLRKSLVDRFYTGKRAVQYEAGRNSSDKWRFEEESLMDLFSGLTDSEVETVADIPVGTNRFAEFLETRAEVRRVYCVDLSIDMLAQAMSRQTSKQVFLRHDILRSPPNLSCGTAISFRFLNLFPFDEVRTILKNIAAITANNMIISVRLADEVNLHGKILAGKVHLHGRDEFNGLLSELGFFVKTEYYHADRKGGRYYVLHAVRSV